MLALLKKLLIALLFAVGVHAIYTFVRSVFIVGANPTATTKDAAEVLTEVATFKR